MKCLICMLVQLNIRCLICINRQHPKHCIEFDNDAVLLNFHSKYNNTTLFIFIHHRVMVETYDILTDKRNALSRFVRCRHSVLIRRIFCFICLYFGPYLPQVNRQSL